MGTRYLVDVECPDCGMLERDVYFAPTCEMIYWICPKCGKKIDLHEYTGIEYDEASSLKPIGSLIE